MEDLSYKSEYAKIILTLLEEKARSLWSFDDLLKSIATNIDGIERLDRLSHEVGHKKIAHLLINKGLESGAIVVSDGGFENNYVEAYSLQ